MVAAVFGIILSFICGMFLVGVEYTEWMWWPILFSFCCLAVLHTVPAVQKVVAEGEEPKKKWVQIAKVVGPYVAAVILSIIAGLLGFSNGPAMGAFSDSYEEAPYEDYEDEALDRP